MVTHQQIALMSTRKNAAKSALSFFKQIKGVKSPNNPFAGFDDREDAWDTLIDSWDNSSGTLVDSFNYTARTGIGNCDEKGKICYMSLKSNPLISRNSIVTLCESVNYDQVFVLITDGDFGGNQSLNALGKTVMIVDGWTED